MNPEKMPKLEDYQHEQDIADEKKRLQREVKRKEEVAALRRKIERGEALEVPMIEQVKAAIDYSIETDTAVVEGIASSAGVLNEQAAIDRASQMIDDWETEYGLKLDEDERGTMITYAKVSLLQAAKDAQVHQKREARAG